MVSNDETRNTLSIHVDIADEATREEADAFYLALSEWVGQWMEAHPDRGQWDPFVHAHTEACDASDHCHGVGSVWARNLVADFRVEMARRLA